ncbi:CopG family transcriptional regulator [Pseudanabaenaceae cyanobacterium LEGE 13415]|nr:CopG family transcriptional regulator [Pseudanabaenaceae cyanobacterium LEGE 13415]
MTQLDEDAANKLTYIQQQTGQDTETILKTAIEQYYQQLQPPQKTALDIFQDFGLVGCIDADPNLSTNYKSVISESFEQSKALLGGQSNA